MKALNRSARAAGFAVLFAAALGASELTAQEAASGEEETPSESHVVDGTVMPPGATEPMEMHFEFKGSGDDLQATIHVPGANVRVELLEPLFNENAFTFAFHEPDGTNRIECVLFREGDDSFKGDCMEEDGGAPGHMTMEPTGF